MGLPRWNGTECEACLPCDEPPCSYTLECWSRSIEKQKCGLFFPTTGAHRVFSDALIEYTTSWTGTATNCEGEAVCCPQTETADVENLINSPSTIIDIGDTCDVFTCDNSNSIGVYDHQLLVDGECQPDPVSLTINPCDNSLTYVVLGPNAQSPITAGNTSWNSGAEVTRGYDNCEDPFRDYTLVTDTDTERTWTYAASAVYDRDGAHPSGCNPCQIPGDPDSCDWNVGVQGDWTVTLSNEVTTAEMLALALPAGGSITDCTTDPAVGSYDTYSPDGSCVACFNLPENELTLYWTSVLIRVTNTAAFTIVFTYDLVNREITGFEEGPCAAEGDETTEHLSTTLTAGACTFIRIDRSLLGANGITYMTSPSCYPL
jgi:hypothetical protein